MHEFSIARNLAVAADEEGRRAGAVRVSRVHARIGVMRMLDAWLMQEAWVVACEGTMCESSELVVQKIRPTATCPECGHTYEFDADRICCPVCATEGGQVVGGDALELVKIDVELEERGEIEGESPALMKG